MEQCNMVRLCELQGTIGALCHLAFAAANNSFKRYTFWRQMAQNEVVLWSVPESGRSPRTHWIRKTSVRMKIPTSVH